VFCQRSFAWHSPLAEHQSIGQFHTAKEVGRCTSGSLGVIMAILQELTMAICETNDPLVQFCGNTQHVIMVSRAAKLLKYFANGPAKDVADLRSEILAGSSTAWKGNYRVLFRLFRSYVSGDEF
jgi:hypothetical protein